MSGAPTIRVWFVSTPWVDLAGRDVGPISMPLPGSSVVFTASGSATTARVSRGSQRRHRPNAGRSSSPRPGGSAPWLSAFDASCRPSVEAVAAATRRRVRSRDTCHLDFNPENVLARRPRPSRRGRLGELADPGPPSRSSRRSSPSSSPTLGRRAGLPGELRARGWPGAARDRSSFAMTLVVQATSRRVYAARALDPSTPATRTGPIGALRRGHRRRTSSPLARIDAWLEARAGLARSAAGGSVGGRGRQPDVDGRHDDRQAAIRTTPRIARPGVPTRPGPWPLLRDRRP